MRPATHLNQHADKSQTSILTKGDFNMPSSIQPANLFFFVHGSSEMVLR